MKLLSSFRGAVLAAFAGLAASSYAAESIHAEDARLAAGVKPCCTTNAEALLTTPSATRSVVNFTAETPHFDFGKGMAPFAVFVLPETGASTLQVYSPMRLRGFVQGGNGQAHYAETVVSFYGRTDQPLEGKLLNSGQRLWGQQSRALYKTFEVPEGAVRVLVSTDPGSNGKTDLSQVRGDRNMPLTADSLQTFGFAGIMPNGYHLSTYGPVVVQVNR
jgi:hypothetical protein